MGHPASRPLFENHEGSGTHGVVMPARSKAWATRLFALLPEIGEGLFTVHRLYPTALEVVVAAIQHLANLGYFLKIYRHRILDQADGSTPVLTGVDLIDVSAVVAA